MLCAMKEGSQVAWGKAECQAVIPTKPVVVEEKMAEPRGQHRREEPGKRT